MLTSTKADHLRYAIKASSEELAQSLIDTNARTRSLLQALTPEQLRVPQLPLLIRRIGSLVTLIGFMIIGSIVWGRQVGHRFWVESMRSLIRH